MRIDHLVHVPLDGADGVALSALAPGVDPERTRVDIAVLAPGAMLPRHPAGRDQDLYVSTTAEI